MKKKIIITVLCILVISTTTLATNIIAENSMYAQIESMTSIEVVERKIDDNFTKLSEIKNAEEFTSIVDCYDRAAYENIYEYIEFLCENKFNQEQIVIINRILENGTTVQSLKEVYEFWLSTDEKFDVIEEICNLEKKFFNEFWYEDAFNHITNNEHGVLTKNDIYLYRESGISTDEILAANILCRKKGQNIFDILDKIKEGQSIEELASEIYGVSQIPDGDSKYDKINKLIEAKKYEIPNEIIENERANVKEILKELEKNYTNLIKDKFDSEIKRLNISKPQYLKNDDYEKMKDCKFPISVKNTLINKGYTPEEIYKTSHMQEEDILEAAKMARKELKNEI